MYYNIFINLLKSLSLDSIIYKIFEIQYNNESTQRKTPHIELILFK